MTADKTVKGLEIPRLVVVLPDGKEVHHHLSAPEMTIGRDPTNRICLTDHFISKFHAKLVRSDASWVLVDLGSANKTYVNGEPIAQATVQFGDAIRFASVDCRLAPPEGAEKRAPSAAPAPAAPVPVPAVPAPSQAQAPSRPAPAPPPAPEKRPPPVPPRAASPASARPAVSPKARSAAPKIEADPMKKLLVVGGLLILISLVLGIFLRILLVPSETSTAETESGAGTGTGTGTATGPATSVTSAPPATSETGTPNPDASSPPSGRPNVDAGGNRTAEFYFDEGLSYLDTGRLKEAQSSFRKVLELNPDHTRAKTRLSLLDEEIETQAQAHFDSAREAFRFLRYEEAIAEWEMFLLLADRGDVRYGEAQQGIDQARAKLR